MKVGALEETITVAANRRSSTCRASRTRTVMTREVLDTMPTGRNIQAVGIMIPGTSLALGGGGALSRDVGGSGKLQQSPLQYRGSGDTVQTIEGLRLNNLCAQGAYSGVYWNDASFQEFSYVTGADSAEMGQGGMRVNMVPRDGGNSFQRQSSSATTPASFASDNCGSPGVGQPCTRTNLTGDTDVQPEQHAHQRRRRSRRSGTSTRRSAARSCKDKVWFNYTFRHWGVNKTKADSYFDKNPVAVQSTTPDPTQPGIDDGHIVSNAGRISWQVSSKDKISVYHDEQQQVPQSLGHRVDDSARGAAIQVTPTSFVNVTKWTRTQTNRLLLEAGFGIYNQEYTELYQPTVTGQRDKVWDWTRSAIRRSTTSSIRRTTASANAWNAPGRSLLAAAHLHGRGLVRDRLAFVPVRRRRSRRATGGWSSSRPATCSRSPTTPARRSSVTLRLPSDRRNGIKADTGIFAQDRWALGRITLNLGLRYDQFIGETQESEVLRAASTPGSDVRQVLRRQERPERRLRRPGPELEGHLAARRRRDGRVRQRPDRDQGELRAIRRRPADRASPTPSTRSARSA